MPNPLQALEILRIHDLLKVPFLARLSRVPYIKAFFSDSIVILCHLLLPLRWPFAILETLFLRALDAGPYFAFDIYASPVNR